MQLLGKDSLNDSYAMQAGFCVCVTFWLYVTIVFVKVLRQEKLKNSRLYTCCMYRLSMKSKHTEFMLRERERVWHSKWIQLHSSKNIYLLTFMSKD